jgi:RNA polymerase sigma factor (sigma-70 family)
MVDELELLCRWQAGDTAAGERVLAQHFWPIYRFFRGKVDGAADDLAQRTFLICLESLHRLRPELGIRAFLFGVARNVLLEWLRRCERDARLDPAVTSLAATTRTHGSRLDERDAGRALREALTELPIDFQIAVELHYWEGLTIVEIAEVLDVPPGTIKSRLSRARAHLRERLGECWPVHLRGTGT